MVEDETVAGVQGKKERAFAGELVISAEGLGFKVKVDRLAYDMQVGVTGRRCLLACSATGNSTEVRALRAAAVVGRKIEFRYRSYPWSHWHRETYLSNDPDGYTTAARCVGYRHYHLVVVSRRPGFLPVATEDALWVYLKGSTTTPMQRSWLPEVSKRLLADKRLVRTSMAGEINSAVVTVDDEYLDGVVTKLLREGLVKIEKRG